MLFNMHQKEVIMLFNMHRYRACEEGHLLVVNILFLKVQILIQKLKIEIMLSIIYLNMVILNIVKYLIEKQNDIDIKGRDGKTPLPYALFVWSSSNC